MSTREGDLRRIEQALLAAREILRAYTPGEVEHRSKPGGSPVTEADLAVDRELRSLLPRPDDGWLSEEQADDPARLDRERVWIVDPIDGTEEFVSGIPEWCVSVGLVEGGRPVAGGILVPPRDWMLLGAVGVGATLNGEPVRASTRETLEGATVLASRSETARGEWERYRAAPFEPRPTGSVAHKLALVAAGRGDATWTRVPKHEWDVAGGVALVLAAGGDVWLPDGEAPRFNRPRPRLPGLFAAGAALRGPIVEFLERDDRRTA